MHAFFSNLANRQTDKHRGQSQCTPSPLSEVNYVQTRADEILQITILCIAKFIEHLYSP